MTTRSRRLGHWQRRRKGFVVGVALVVKIRPHVMANSAECRQILLADPVRGSASDSLTAFDRSVPNRLGLRSRFESFAATVIGATVAFQPTVTLHAGDDACEGRRFNSKTVGNLRLRRFSVDGNPSENFPLPQRDVLLFGEFGLQRATNRMRRRAHPITDAFLPIERKHSLSAFPILASSFTCELPH